MQMSVKQENHTSDIYCESILSEILKLKYFICTSQQAYA